MVLFNNGTVISSMASDCCKAGGAGLGFAVAFFIEQKFIRFDVRANSKLIQAIKYLVGLLVALGLKGGLKIIIGENLLADIFRYFIVVLWVIAIYPFLIKKFVSYKTADV